MVICTKWRVLWFYYFFCMSVFLLRTPHPPQQGVNPWSTSIRNALIHYLTSISVKKAVIKES